MDESVLGQVQAMIVGYGFTVRIAGSGAAEFASIVFDTESEARKAREAMREVVAKAVAIV